MRQEQNARLARGLRRSANFSEQTAWNTLRNLRRHGFVVRRQHSVGRYIVDFAVVKARLIIEIEGGIHSLPEVAARDALRRQEIEMLGWRILRSPTETALSADHLLALVQRELGI